MLNKRYRSRYYPRRKRLPRLTILGIPGCPPHRLPYRYLGLVGSPGKQYIPAIDNQLPVLVGAYLAGGGEGPSLPWSANPL
jgi:hypothetical protein